jgi:heat shock protein HtpX
MAIALMVGFYALALGIAGILIWIPIEEYNLIGRITARIAFICWGLAATIVWSLIPRVDRFEAPGPRLTRATDPEVFRLIEDVAQATNQAQPEEVCGTAASSSV